MSPSDRRVSRDNEESSAHSGRSRKIAMNSLPNANCLCTLTVRFMQSRLRSGISWVATSYMTGFFPRNRLTR